MFGKLLRFGALSLALAGVVATATPATAQARRGPAECAQALDCTAAEIDLLTMPERIQLVRAMSDGPAAQFGATGRWRNIEGILAFFADHGLGVPGTWVSHVDSGILEGIERGLALASGRSTDTFGNPGSRKWADYVTRLAAGQLAVRGDHDRAWSEAEQASTDHGLVLAARHGTVASAVERRFFLFSEFYRFSLRNRPVVLDLLAIYGWMIDPDLARLRVPFHDWFTDVREETPARKGAELSYALANLDPINGVFSTLDLILAYIPELFEEYEATH